LAHKLAGGIAGAPRTDCRSYCESPVADYAASMIYKPGAGMVGQGHGLADQNRRFGLPGRVVSTRRILFLVAAPLLLVATMQR
jgi:hypothetical protein